MRVACFALACLCAALAPDAAAGSRFAVLPSLTLSQAYDDNLLSSPERPQRDSVSGAAPRLELVLRSPRFGGRVAYLQQAELFREHGSFDTLAARRDGVLELRLAGRRGLRLEAVQGYRSTLGPGELALATGLELGRFPARQLSSALKLALGLGARVTGTLAYSFVDDAIRDGVSGRSQSFEAQLHKQTSPRVSFACRYALRRFTDRRASSSHVLGLGGSAAITRDTRLKILVGPRLTGGRLEAAPEAEAELRHAFRHGELTLAYARSQTRVVGQVGVASTETGALRLAHELFVPGLRIGISPGVFRTRHPAFAATVYRLESELEWSSARWLSLAASHGFAAVRGGPLGDVTHNVVSLRLVVKAPERPLRGARGAAVAGEPE